MADEQVRLIFQTDTAQVKAAKPTVAELKAEIDRLNDVLTRGAPGWETAKKQIDATEKELRDVQRAARDAGEAMEDVTGRSGRGANNLGLALNAAAQGLEDLQYSVGGAMNNLAQFAMLLGAGGGVVTAVTLAGVAVNQLFRHWDKLFGDEVPTYADNVEKLKARLKELEERPSKLRIDYEEIDAAKREIDRLTEAKRTLDAALGKQVQEEADSGRMIEEFRTASVEARQAIADITEAQVQQAQQSPEMIAAQQAKAQADARLKAAQEAMRGPAMSPAEAQQRSDALDRATARAREAQAQLDATQRRVSEEARAGVGAMIARAERGTGEEQRQAQAQLADLLSRVGGAGPQMAGQIRGVRPDLMRNADPADLDALNEEALRTGKEATRRRITTEREATRQREQDAREIDRINTEEAAKKRDAQRKADRAAAGRAREMADLQGPRFEPGVRDFLEQARLRGVPDWQANLQAANQVAQELGGGVEAFQAANEIVGGVARDLTRDVMRLVGQGLTAQQATLQLLQQDRMQLQQMMMQQQDIIRQQWQLQNQPMRPGTMLNRGRP